MDTVAKYLRLRCFLEGVEIPVIGAVVQITLNFPAVATIQVVPPEQSSTPPEFFCQRSLPSPLASSSLHSPLQSTQ